MAKVSAKDSSRSRSKGSSALEAVATSITKLQELLVQAEDLKQEGFPYRDAVRARVELHVRECAKVVFGDRASESQQWKHYHMRATTPAEVVTTIAQLHELLAQLERKKLELLGIPPPPPSPPEDQNHREESIKPAPAVAEASRREKAPAPSPASHASTVPASTTATTELRKGSLPAPEPTSITVPSPPPSELPESPPSPPSPSVCATSDSPPPQASAPLSSPSPTSPQASERLEAPIAPEPREQGREAVIQVEAQAAAPRPLVTAHAGATQDESPSQISGRSGVPEPSHSESPILQSSDPLDTIRKICGRFHSVVRQLRLRREYRPTIDVEDERDVQDLMFTLLRYELEEVSTHEWVPPYQAPTPSVAMVLPRHRLVMLAKKTRSGHGAREIAQELIVDGQEFSPTNGHQSIACFVYDPDGRIGNPRSLEAELTKVSDAQVLEVIIYPK
ncbi:hypothetical protein YTPLAS18_12270 [Nitrospira sp.]|nr:hypothetical protein YTPLAS18_12270 [Nitrospira sp.]